MSEDFKLNTVKYPPLKNVISLKWPPSSLSWTRLPPLTPPTFWHPFLSIDMYIYRGFFGAKKKSWVTSRRKEKNENKIRKAQEMRLEQSAGQLLGNWTIEVAGQIFSLIEDNWIIKLPNADFAQKLTRRFHLNPLLWLKEFLAQPLQNI